MQKVGARVYYTKVNAMTLPSKKFLIILLSVIIGVLIILSAAKMSGIIGTSDTPKNDDGELWKTALSVLPGTKTPTSVEKSDIQIDDTDTATTTTDLLARKLLVEYIQASQNAATSTISDFDAQNIANILAQDVELPFQKKYTLSDLNISNDNGETAGSLYKKTLNTLIQNHVATEQSENELTILITAMDTDNADILNKLDTKIALYEKLITNLLAIKTPSLVAQIHLHLIQGYETMRSATVGFKSILSDPVVGVASLTEYRNGIDMLTAVEKEYRDFSVANQ